MKCPVCQESKNCQGYDPKDYACVMAEIRAMWDGSPKMSTEEFWQKVDQVYGQLPYCLLVDLETVFIERHFS